MGKILVFMFDEMTDYEITFISHLLGSDAGKEIIPIAYEDKLITGKTNFTYKPSMLVHDVLSLDNIEGLIIPGGWYGDAKPELMELINKLYSRGTLISAICGAGTILLAKSGILKNVKYTTPATEWTQKHIQIFGEKDPFPRENYIPERVVTDKNVITAIGTAFIDFALEICDWYKLFETPKEKLEFMKTIKG